MKCTTSCDAFTNLKVHYTGERYGLSIGIEVRHLYENETRYLHKENFVDCDYRRNEISFEGARCVIDIRWKLI